MTTLVTPEQLAAYPRTPAGTDTAAALPLLEAVSDAVRDYCGWHIAPAITETVTVDGSGAEVQGLPTLWLLDVVAVFDAGTALDVAGVEWSTNGILKRPGYCWTTKLRGVEAEIEHGYAVTPPAVLALICEMVLRGAVVPVGTLREQSGGESVTWSTDDVQLTARETRILDRRYRIANRP